MAASFTFKHPARSLWHPSTLLATWFGAGLLPAAPGTWGSLAALPFAWAILYVGGPAALLVAAGLCFAVGWWATWLYARHAGAKDPGEIVIDEVAGQWLAVLVADPKIWWHWLAGFILFRICDIIKPFPAGAIDRQPGPLAIMADDAVAAVYALFLLAIVIFAQRFVHGS